MHGHIRHCFLISLNRISGAQPGTDRYGRRLCCNLTHKQSFS